MKIRYTDKALSIGKRALIAQANVIVDEYHAQGFDLTLRQIYYQFVARDLIPNTMRSYKRLGDAMSDGRLAGLIDWHSIVDRTRNVKSNAHWDTPESIVETCADQFAVDLWEGQAHRVEVWIEKEALIGVISGVCAELDVPHFACKGYVSQSEQWRAGRRLRGWAAGGQTPVVIHLGDHDPSGIDMTRDIRDRLSMFAETPVIVERIALNMEQIEEFKPPPNPTKLSDSRAASYVEQFGYESWELDALDPTTLANLIRSKVGSFCDTTTREKQLDRQALGRDMLNSIASRWDDVVQFLEGSE